MSSVLRAEPPTKLFMIGAAISKKALDKGIQKGRVIGINCCAKLAVGYNQLQKQAPIDADKSHDVGHQHEILFEFACGSGRALEFRSQLIVCLRFSICLCALSCALCELEQSQNDLIQTPR